MEVISQIKRWRLLRYQLRCAGLSSEMAPTLNFTYGRLYSAHLLPAMPVGTLDLDYDKLKTDGDQPQRLRTTKTSVTANVRVHCVGKWQKSISINNSQFKQLLGGGIAKATPLVSNTLVSLCNIRKERDIGSDQTTSLISFQFNYTITYHISSQTTSKCVRWLTHEFLFKTAQIPMRKAIRKHQIFNNSNQAIAQLIRVIINMSSDRLIVLNGMRWKVHVHQRAELTFGFFCCWSRCFCIEFDKTLLETRINSHHRKHCTYCDSSLGVKTNKTARTDLSRWTLCYKKEGGFSDEIQIMTGGICVPF